jgi:hypothetical protein
LAPFFTEKVELPPLVNVIKYTSESPIDPIFLIDSIPLPVSPFGPISPLLPYNPRGPCGPIGPICPGIPCGPYKPSGTPKVKCHSLSTCANAASPAGTVSADAVGTIILDKGIIISPSTDAPV